MENNEKYIVKNIQDHHEEIDLDGLWADIAPHIPKEEKRKRVGFWIFGGLVVGVLILAMFWSTDLDAKLTESIPSDDKKIKLFKKDEVHSEVMAGLNVEEKSIKPQEVSQKISINSKINEGDISYTNFTNEEKIPKINSEQNRETNRSFALNTPLNNTSITNNSDLKYNELNPISKSENNKEHLEQIQFGNTITLEDYTIQRDAILSIHPLPDKVKFINKNRLQDFPELDVKVPTINKGVPNINRWNAYLVGGAGIVNRKLFARSPEKQPERDRRMAVLDVLGCWEIEGGIGFRLSPKMKISSGVNYTQIHEKADFQTDYIIDIESTTSNVINRQNGSIENEIITSSGEGLRHTDEIRYNQLKLWQIPIRMSYQIFASDRFKFNLGAMGAYTFQQKYSGFTSFSSTEESYDLSLDIENKFRKSGSLSYGVYLESTTHLTPNLDLAFSLGYKQTRKINSEIYLIDQQYNSLSLTSGIYRRF